MSKGALITSAPVVAVALFEIEPPVVSVRVFPVVEPMVKEPTLAVSNRMDPMFRPKSMMGARLVGLELKVAISALDAPRTVPGAAEVDQFEPVAQLLSVVPDQVALAAKALLAKQKTKASKAPTGSALWLLAGVRPMSVGEYFIILRG